MLSSVPSFELYPSRLHIQVGLEQSLWSAGSSLSLSLQLTYPPERRTLRQTHHHGRFRRGGQRQQRLEIQPQPCLPGEAKEKWWLDRLRGEEQPSALARLVVGLPTPHSRRLRRFCCGRGGGGGSSSGWSVVVVVVDVVYLVSACIGRRRRGVVASGHPQQHRTETMVGHTPPHSFIEHPGSIGIILRLPLLLPSWRCKHAAVVVFDLLEFPPLVIEIVLSIGVCGGPWCINPRVVMRSSLLAMSSRFSQVPGFPRNRQQSGRVLHFFIEQRWHRSRRLRPQRVGGWWRFLLPTPAPLNSVVGGCLVGRGGRGGHRDPWRMVGVDG